MTEPPPTRQSQPGRASRRSAADHARRHALLGVLMLIVAVSALIAALTNFSNGLNEVGAAMAAAAVAMAVGRAYFRKHRPPMVIAGNLFVALLFVTLTGANLVSGGAGLGTHFAIGVVPMFAVLLSGRLSGVVWLVLSVAEVLLIRGLHASGHTFLRVPTPSDYDALQLTGPLILLAMFTGLAVAYEYLKTKALDDAAQANAVLDEALRAAERATEAKSRFLANMSHEIRTPMNGVLGMLELMKRSDSLERTREQAAIAHRSGAALLELLNGIVDMSRVEQGAMSIRTSATDVDEVLSHVVAVMRPVAEAKGLELTFEIDPEVPRWLMLDALRVRQIVTNLASNAVKFTPSGSVVIHAGVTSELLEVTVTDTGPGIDPADHHKVFENFGQSDDSNTREQGGAGLGLSIAAGLAELMGGSLTVESELGQGAAFTLRLPAVEPSAESLSILQTPPPGAMSSLPAVAERPMHILVVDDDWTNRTVAQGLLEELGHTSETAENGAEAVELAAAHDYDLVLMDCMMPVMDGYEATRRIRQLDGPRGAVTIVALTGNAMLGDEQRGRDAGMDDYLNKPVRLPLLRQKLLELRASHRGGDRKGA